MYAETSLVINVRSLQSLRNLPMNDPIERPGVALDLLLAGSAQSYLSTDS